MERKRRNRPNKSFHQVLLLLYLIHPQYLRLPILSAEQSYVTLSIPRPKLLHCSEVPRALGNTFKPQKRTQFFLVCLCVMSIDYMYYMLVLYVYITMYVCMHMYILYVYCVYGVYNWYILISSGAYGAQSKTPDVFFNGSALHCLVR